MRKLRMRSFMLIGALCVIVTAWAADNAYATENDTRRCLKRKPNQPYTGNIPSNFKLLLPCPGAEGDGVTSTYTFVGEAIVDGTVKYGSNDTLGMYAMFVIGKDSMSLVPANLRSFRLKNRDLERFHLPQLDDSKDQCYSAHAKIRITELGYVDEGGTDADGPYLGKYEVLKVDNVQSHMCARE